ncbi:MAG: DeoR/GlpR family DNA-binding transcription regulator [Nocardioidaceae bacterium]|nr:DeoR/GlpR family DNA-binding transcription regulator [Nocardioidaceae bacterium]
MELVSERGHVSVTDVADALEVSEATARRDISQLAEQRLLTRTHGGATALGSSYELPLQYKISRQADAKLAIARAAAALLRPGMAIAMNGGTTTTEVARAIGRSPDLSADGCITVVTNALNIAYELSIRPNVVIVVIGGTARSQSYELVGPLSDGVLDRVNVEAAVLGVDGITPDGITTVHPAEAQLSAELIRVAARVIVVADNTKLGRSTFARIAPLDAVDQLITDLPVDGSLADDLAAAGVEVVIADGAAPAH